MLPDSIPSSVWEEFRKHRKRLRAPMTEHVETLILVKLEKWKIENGANPVDVLNESMERGWRGIFLNGHGKLSSELKIAQSNVKKYCDRCQQITWWLEGKVCSKCGMGEME